MLYITALFLAPNSMVYPTGSQSTANSQGEVQRFTFRRTVDNVEYLSSPLDRDKPDIVKKAPSVNGELWYGAIVRRLPGEGPRDTEHYIPFAVEYLLGVPNRAWCDNNLDGDLTNDLPARLWDYPGVERGRSFLAEFRWSVQSSPRAIPVVWTVRVVLEPSLLAGEPPHYRLQMVYAMDGIVALEGKPHRAFLIDGNGDGLYSKEFMDGIFVDLNDDRKFLVDLMSPEFGPFAVPFQMGRGIYQIDSVEPDGSEITLRRIGTAEEVNRPKVGESVPDFSFRDLDGRTVRLAAYRGKVVIVDFWASWCGSAAAQARELRQLYDRYHPLGLEILGVSFDTDRSAMEAFRRENQLAWPISFSGHDPWEDPIGRQYGEPSGSAAYLLDREGRLKEIYHDIRKLAPALAEMFPMAPDVR